MKAPVTYIEKLVAHPFQCFAALWDGLPWEKRHFAPRRECWFNPYGQPYTYGAGAFARTYEARPLTGLQGNLISSIMSLLNRMDGASYDCCFVNGYEHGREHLGWHSDDSPEMDADHPIATVSLGAEREIWFRRKKDPEDLRTLMVTMGMTEKLPLASGSAAIMAAGMQQQWQHRIPKSPRGEDCPPRISLTYRKLVR